MSDAGNWMRLDGDHPTLTVRHFFYDWDTEVASSLRIERLGDAVGAESRSVDPDAACRGSWSPSATSSTTT